MLSEAYIRGSQTDLDLIPMVQMGQSLWEKYLRLPKLYANICYLDSSPTSHYYANRSELSLYVCITLPMRGQNWTQHTNALQLNQSNMTLRKIRL